ncbi:MAG: YqaJ viral recombinase family protein, partial [Nitrospinota bacterium]|nr:YqaJ viral recombinase family protein [Nitrospinota bacterium]
GSDVADVLSLEPYGCAARLYDEKIGTPPDYPEAYNPHMERGKALEEVAAQEYLKAAGGGCELVSATTEADELRPWMRGNADRIIQPLDDAPGILELKCPARQTFLSLKKDGLPDSWILQMQHYLYVYDLTWGAFGILWAEGWEFVHFRVKRDDQLIFQLIEREKEFWEAVTYNRRPEKLPEGDKRCRGCNRRVTCRGLDLAVDLAIPEGPDGIGERREDLRGDEGISMAVLDVIEAAEIEKEAADWKEDCREALKKLLGPDKREFRTHDARVSWTPGHWASAGGRLVIKPYGD